MPFQISPGVNVTEIDLTTIVPSVATTEGAIAGVFKWGPIGERVLVDTEQKLVSRFGKPTSHNPETFFTAANFLAYGNRLYVSRAANTTGGSANDVMSALANTGEVSTPTNYNVKNEDDYNAKRSSSNFPDDDVLYIAKYPGSFGNSLKVSVCDSANAWSTTQTLTGTAINASATSVSANIGSNTILVVVTPSDFTANVTAANTSAANARASLTVGDFIEVGNSTIGKQYSRVTSISSQNNAIYFSAAATYSNGTTTMTVSSTAGYRVGANVSGTGIPAGAYITSIDGGGTTFEISANATGTSSTLAITAPATFSVTVNNLIRTKSNWSSTSFVRYWEYFGSFDGAPGQSQFLSSLVAENPGLYSSVAGVNDEMHIIVVDEDGDFTGVPGTVLEKFGSLSRITNARSDQGASIYYVDAINAGSQYIWWANDRTGALSQAATSIANSTNVKPLSLSFQGGQDGDNELTIDVVNLYNAIDLFASAEDVDISLILQGKARGGDSGQQFANYIIDNICEKRKDCVLFVSPDQSDVVNNLYQEADAVIGFRNSLTSTSYAVMDTGYKYQYDRYNDVYRWVPLNGDIAGLCARTDNVRDPWFSPAGFNRGIIKNVVKLAYNPAKAERDSLYKSDVNPVINIPGTGTVLYGDKTLLGKPSAFDRINVRRLFIVLEKAIATASKYTLFEFNDAFTRAQFRNLIEPFLRDVQGRRGIFDFRVVCDESNNTSEVIDRNEFIGDIYIKPARSINFIQLNFVAVRTGVNFNEIVGFRT